MNLELGHFKKIILILKNSTNKDLIQALESLRTHWSLTNKQYEDEMNHLKNMIVRYNVLANQIVNSQQQVVESKLNPWIPVLKGQQEAAVYQDVAYDTLMKVSSSKKELDSYNKELSEIGIRLQLYAKSTKATRNTLETAELQMYILENAIEVLGYLNAQGISASSIAEYEITKYYELYRGRG